MSPAVWYGVGGRAVRAALRFAASVRAPLFKDAQHAAERSTADRDVVGENNAFTRRT